MCSVLPLYSSQVVDFSYLFSATAVDGMTMATTCSTMTGYLFDTIIVASADKCHSIDLSSVIVRVSVILKTLVLTLADFLTS